MNLSLGRIKGIKIQIHFTFWLIIIWGALRYGSFNDLPGLLYGASLTLMLFAIVLLHELGHSFAALAFKIPVRDITLLPIGGVARLERMPEKPVQELIIALAGPLVNLALLFVLLPALWLVADGRLGWQWVIYRALNGPSLFGAVSYLFVVNLSLLAFNMIPAFPLDGGRVFRSIMAIFMGRPRATQVAVWVGRTFAVLLGLVGLRYGNFFTAFIAIFIFSAGGMEGKAVAVKDRLRGVRVRNALSRVGSVVLQPNFTIMEVASMTLHSHQANFPVMLGNSLLGVIRRQDIRQALERGGSLATVAEVMRRDVPRLDAEASLVEAQEELVRSESYVAAVYDDFQFLGLIGFEDIERAFHMLANQRAGSYVGG